jgi:hypothetical protein
MRAEVLSLLQDRRLVDPARALSYAGGMAAGDGGVRRTEGGGARSGGGGGGGGDHAPKVGLYMFIHSLKATGLKAAGLKAAGFNP